ncbi:MAG: universal stress protein [Dehalococcoidia bacterium]|nr:universal stress protein [Dehalococcoidia bacterium]
MYQRILVPLDGSKLAEAVLPHVEEISKGCNVVTVILMRVIPPLYLAGDYTISQTERERIETAHRAEAESYLKQVAGQLRDAGVNAETEVVPGNAAETIVNYAENNDVDLIIIATHGRSGIARWALGSVADRVVRLSCAPVFMVRPPGCVAGL